MWYNPQFSAELVTFTENSLVEKFIFCAVSLICYTKSNKTKPNQVVNNEKENGRMKSKKYQPFWFSTSTCSSNYNFQVENSIKTAL